MMYMLVPQIEKFSYLKYFFGGLTTQKLSSMKNFRYWIKYVCKFSHACVIEHHEAIHCRHFPYLVISQVGIALGQKDGYTSPIYTPSYYGLLSKPMTQQKFNRRIFTQTIIIFGSTVIIHITHLTPICRVCMNIV